MLLEPGRVNIQTFLIDPLSGSESSARIHDRTTEMIPVQPWQTWCMFRLSPQLFLKYYRYDLLIKKKKKKLRCVCLCTCVDLFGIWVRRTGEHSGGKEGHGITYPHSVIEYGRLLVMPKSVRSPCPVSLSVCPAWNFCLILRWGEEAVINTPQYLPCPLVLRESFTASLLRSYVNQNVHQKPFATLSTACKYMCTCKQPWQD